MSAFKNAWRSPIKDDRTRSHREIVEDLRRDRGLIARLGVTPEEIETLSSVSMLGKLTSKQDALFILRQIREARGPFVSPSTPETFLVPYQKIEPAIPETSVMAEWIRSTAMAKLRELESRPPARYRSRFQASLTSCPRLRRCSVGGVSCRPGERLFGHCLLRVVAFVSLRLGGQEERDDSV